MRPHGFQKVSAMNLHITRKRNRHYYPNSMADSRGFTLVEMLTVVAIIGILATIALPAYENYLKKSRAKSATSDLVALGLNFENAYQRTLTYPTSTAASTSEVKTLMPGWAPSQEQFFGYSVSSSSTAYTLTAAGSGSLSGCTIKLTSDNTRTASGGPCDSFTVW